MTALIELWSKMQKLLYSREQIVLQEMLRDARLSANMTQEKLSEALEKPQSFVSKYERGERILNPIELLLILRALGKPPSEFIDKLATAVGIVAESKGSNSA